MISTSPRLIVLAEDNGADVFLIREAIEQRKLVCDLHPIDDGEDMLHFIDRVDQDESLRCPDLFLLDLNLPKRSGDEILEHLKQSRRCSGVPVIVITSSESRHDRERAAELGAAAYFCKPADLDRFLQIGDLIQAHLKANSAHG